MSDGGHRRSGVTALAHDVEALDAVGVIRQGLHLVVLARVLVRHHGRVLRGQHFKGKDALLLAVLEFHDRAWAARFEPPAHGLRRLLDRMLDVGRDTMASPGLTRLFATTAGEATDPAHPSHAYFQRRFDLMRTNNAHAVRASRRGTGQGRRRSRRTGPRVVACAEGLTAQWLMDPTFDPVEHVREHFDLLMRSVVTDGGGLTPP